MRGGKVMRDRVKKEHIELYSCSNAELFLWVGKARRERRKLQDEETRILCAWECFI
jgi:hypothetical protein